MEPVSESDLRFEIGHVLFLDIVGYSKLLIEEQKERLGQLTAVVLGTAQVRESTDEQLVRLPTGDGMALVFHHSPEEPARCALQVAEALRRHPEIRVRMGIHSGPVSEVTDVSGRPNLAGAGINMAQRVMDCGDAGHILLSQHVADDLAQYRQWAPRLRDLGECEVKHGVRLRLVNLYAEPLGNPEPPAKFRRARHKQAGRARSSSTRWIVTGAAALVFAGLVATLVVWMAGTDRGAVRSATATERRGASITVPEKSIAILPFENLSSDKENAFFAEGVQDQILTDLARIAELRVISRTSVMQFKSGRLRNLREIAQQLGVAHVVEGSVQRAANKVRVIAQLIDARNDAHLWAQTYDRDLADVFAIQSEIAEAIAQQLQAHLSANEKAALGKPSTNDPVTYDLYLRARQLDDLTNDPDAKGSLLQGISLLEEAVRRDPKFLRAYCLICETHLDLYWSGFDHTDQRREMAHAALQKAEEIEPDAGEVHWMRGLYAYHGFRDYDRAIVELNLAEQRLPNEARLYVLAGAVDRRTARFPEAEANFKRAVELDPRNFVVVMEAGSTFQGMRRYPEGKRLCEQALTILPNDPFALFAQGFSSFAQTGDAAAWRKPSEQIAQQGPEAARSVAFPLLICSWMQRDRSLGEKAAALLPAEGIADSFDEASLPREYCVGRTAWLFGDKDLARTALTAARATFERATQQQSDYSQAWSYLGLTDAMLGRRDDAIREGKYACEILPYTKDSWIGPAWITNLAAIYTWSGDQEAALETLATGVQLPVGISYGELKQSPDWDALRGDARFEKLLASLAPKPATGESR